MSFSVKDTLLPKTKTTSLVYQAFAAAATGGLLFGYVIGVTGNAVYEQSKDGKGGFICRAGGDATVSFTSTCFDVSDRGKALLCCFNIIFALVSTLICFRFAAALGRRRELLIGSALYAVGALISCLAVNIGMVWTGQALYGLGVGFSMHAAPIFIAEISPAHIRGLLVSGKEAMVVVGILLGFSAGAIFGNTIDGWRYELGVPMVFALPMFVGMWWVPPSPRWLMTRQVTAEEAGEGETSRADMCASLRHYRRNESDHEVEEEVDSVVQSLMLAEVEEPAKIFDAFKERSALTIGCGLVFLQQITGQPSVLYYATSIFKSAGFGADAALQSVYVGLAKLVFTVLTVFTVDKFGRKPLLFAGISLMLVALALLGLAFEYTTCSVSEIMVAGQNITLDADNCYLSCMIPTKGCTDNIALPNEWGVVAVGSLIVYVAGYQIGFGPIAWLIISEIFPLKTRGAAMSLAAVTNFGTNILVTFFFEDVIEAVGSSVAFWCYGILCIVSLAFVHFVVPETKGLTLEEIDAKLNRRSDEKKEDWANILYTDALANDGVNKGTVKEEVVEPLLPVV